MNVPLPLPNPADWLSSQGAQTRLGVSRVTLLRMVKDQRLHRYTTADGRQSLYWAAEVNELARARVRVAAGGSR